MSDDLSNHIHQVSMQLAAPHLISQHGYVNVTQLCKQAGKEFKHYNSNKKADEFKEALAAARELPLDTLQYSITDGPNDLRGTWAHPEVAIHVAAWLGPAHQLVLTSILYRTLEATAPTPQQQARASAAAEDWSFERRKLFMTKNRPGVPKGHFTMYEESLGLQAIVEGLGIFLPYGSIPDGSMGQTFCNYLRGLGYNVLAYPTYRHEYPDGRVVEPRAYPNELLTIFRDWLERVYIPDKFPKYVKERLDAGDAATIKRVLAS